MAKQVLIENASGWMTPLPASARSQINHRWPSVSLKSIDVEFGNYLLVRNALSRQMEPAAIRERYLGIKHRVAELLADVRWLRGNNLEALIQISSPAEYFGNLKRLERELSVLNGLLPLAENSLPEGHQLNARRVLVENLVGTIRSANIEINAKPQGALCSIASILIEASGETTSNIVSIVKPVLVSLKKTPGK